MEHLVETDPCGAALAALDFVTRDAHPTVTSILDATSVATGKKVKQRFLPALQGRGATGIWFERPRHNVIFQPPPVSAHHCSFVLLHEVGHILFAWKGWAPVPELSLADPATLTIDELIAAASAHRMNLRLPGEQAAERFAYAAVQRIRARNRRRDNYQEQLS